MVARGRNWKEDVLGLFFYGKIREALYRVAFIILRKSRRKRRLIMLLKKYTVVLLSTAMLSLLVSPVSAAEQCSITIKEQIRDQNERVVTVDGSELSVSQVAVINSSGEYMLSNGYEKSKINISNIKTADQESKEADELSKYTPSKSIIETTDSKGIAVFSRLSQGIYLVKEIAKTGTAKNCTDIKPYLLSVPLSGQNGMQYNVTSYPKIQKYTPDIPNTKNNTKPKPDKKNRGKRSKRSSLKKVKTGDSTQIAKYIIAIMLIAVILLARKLRKTE